MIVKDNVMSRCGHSGFLSVVVGGDDVIIKDNVMSIYPPEAEVAKPMPGWVTRVARTVIKALARCWR